MQIIDKIMVKDTGQGFTNTYKHQLHLDRYGVPCPVLCYMDKGHSNEKFVYQIINDQKGFLITSEGSEQTTNNSISLWGDWPLLEINLYKDSVAVVNKIAKEVYSWGTGRLCHFPPNYQRRITPEIFDPSIIDLNLHHPWMKGGLILYGGGRGVKHGNMFISKVWKLSQPHVDNWDDPDQEGFGGNKLLQIGSCTISSNVKIDILKELTTNYLCRVSDGQEAIVTLMDANGVCDSTTVKGMFRCGTVER